MEIVWLLFSELSLQSQVQETQENWKPSFLSNEEFTHLMLEVIPQSIFNYLISMHLSYFYSHKLELNYLKP